MKFDPKFGLRARSWRVDDVPPPLYKAAVGGGLICRHCSFDGSGIVSGLCFDRIAQRTISKNQSFDIKRFATRGRA